MVLEFHRNFLITWVLTSVFLKCMCSLKKKKSLITVLWLLYQTQRQLIHLFHAVSVLSATFFIILCGLSASLPTHFWPFKELILLFWLFSWRFYFGLPVDFSSLFIFSPLNYVFLIILKSRLSALLRYIIVWCSILHCNLFAHCLAPSIF